MGLTIYIRLSDEESQLIQGVAGRRHNRWAKHILLREAAASIPIAEIKRALEASGMDETRQAAILARLENS